MTLRRSLTRLLLVGSLAAAGLVAAAPPATAAFHLMKIREVGLDVEGGEDFVELQMYSSGQTQLQDHDLLTYGSSGALNQSYNIPSNVTNGANQATILFATPGFTLATPDFTINNGMAPSGGAVCFQDGMTLQPIDCVEWGTTGVGTVAADPPAPAPPDGNSLERKITAGCASLLEAGDDTGSSAADFAAQPTPNPEPNGATPNETTCAPTSGGSSLQDLKAKVKGGKAIITGTIEPPAPGEKVSLTFFANGSSLRKIATKSATLDADSKFKKRFKVPADSTRCKIKVAFAGSTLGKKKFRC